MKNHNDRVIHENSLFGIFFTLKVSEPKKTLNFVWRLKIIEFFGFYTISTQPGTQNERVFGRLSNLLPDRKNPARCASNKNVGKQFVILETKLLIIFRAFGKRFEKFLRCAFLNNGFRVIYDVILASISSLAMHPTNITHIICSSVHCVFTYSDNTFNCKSWTETISFFLILLFLFFLHLSYHHSHIRTTDWLV